MEPDAGDMVTVCGCGRQKTDADHVYYIEGKKEAVLMKKTASDPVCLIIMNIR